MERKAVVSLLFFGMLWIAGCGGGTFSWTSGQSSSITGVNLLALLRACSLGRPVSAQPVQRGCTYSTGVTWSAVSGMISNTGLYIRLLPMLLLRGVTL